MDSSEQQSEISLDSIRVGGPVVMRDKFDVFLSPISRQVNYNLVDRITHFLQNHAKLTRKVSYLLHVALIK
jgi:hypothetical protein